jgi:hypothetical protein
MVQRHNLPTAFCRRADAVDGDSEAQIANVIDQAAGEVAIGGIFMHLGASLI